MFTGKSPQASACFAIAVFGVSRTMSLASLKAIGWAAAVLAIVQLFPAVQTAEAAPMSAAGSSAAENRLIRKCMRDQGLPTRWGRKGQMARSAHIDACARQLRLR
jgi:hypothetical protein